MSDKQVVTCRNEMVTNITKKKKNSRDNDVNLVIVKGLIHQEDIILNVYAPNNKFKPHTIKI